MRAKPTTSDSPGHSSTNSATRCLTPCRDACRIVNSQSCVKSLNQFSPDTTPKSTLYESDLGDIIPIRSTASIASSSNVVTRSRAFALQAFTRRNVLTNHSELRERSPSPNPIGLITCAKAKYLELLLAFAFLSVAALTESYEPKSYLEAQKDFD